MEDVCLSCCFGEVREIEKSGLGRLDVCTIEHADSGTGGSRTHVSAQAVDYEVFAGVSGVDDDRGDNTLYVRRRGAFVEGNGSVNSFSRTTSAAATHHVGGGGIAFVIGGYAVAALANSETVCQTVAAVFARLVGLVLLSLGVRLWACARAYFLAMSSAW
jgi:hypothetical protein